MSESARYIQAQMPSTHFSTRNAQEADGHQHASDRHLVVAEFDAVQILNAQTVCGDQAVESEDFVHLNRGDEGAATLSDDMGN